MQISSSVRIPVAVKISPYYSSLSHTACSFADAGAAGLVCFNRFYQPDLDPDTREVMPCVDLSESWELRLPLRWIAILRPLLPEVSLAATTGISTGRDVAKALLVGADVAMMTSALLRHGPEHVARVERELQEWATEHEYDSVDQLRGSVSHATTDDPAAFERANYMHILQSYETPSRERLMIHTSDPGAFPVDLLIADTVVCVTPTATLREVADVLIRNSIGAVVVGSQDIPLGIVSEHDIVRAVADGVGPATTAADIAHTELYWTQSSNTVADVATQMMDQYVRHILVEDSGRLAGIISARDLLGVYAIRDSVSGNEGDTNHDAYSGDDGASSA